MRKETIRRISQPGSLTFGLASSRHELSKTFVFIKTYNHHHLASDDMYAPESIELLQKSGIDFQRHEEIGISPNDFAELMITSGLVLTPDTKWISFHR
jgi:hypothetical protein